MRKYDSSGSAVREAAEVKKTEEGVL